MSPVFQRSALSRGVLCEIDAAGYSASFVSPSGRTSRPFARKNSRVLAYFRRDDLEFACACMVLKELETFSMYLRDGEGAMTYANNSEEPLRGNLDPLVGTNHLA